MLSRRREAGSFRYEDAFALLLRTPHAEFFADIPRSTDRRVRGDTFADLAELEKAVRERPDCAPHTRAVLSELGLL